MADKKATLIIQLKDLASKKITGVGNAIEFVKRNALALTAAFVSLSAGVFTTLRAFADTEKAIKKANAAMLAAGDFSKRASEDIQDFASAIQRSTVVSNEGALELFSLAKSFVDTNEEAKALVSTAIDFGTAADLNFTEALRRLGRATQGSAADVANFVPEIRNLTKEQLKSGEATRLLAERFAGQASAQTQTFEGRVIQLNNAFQDLRRDLGELLVGPAEGFIGFLRQSLPLVKQTIGALKIRFNIGQLDLAQSIARRDVLRQEIDDIRKRSAGEGLFSDAVKERIADVVSLTNRINELREAERREISERAREVPKRKPIEEAVDEKEKAKEEEELAKLREQAQKRIDLFTLTQTEMEQKETDRIANALEMKQGALEAEAAMDLAAAEEKLANEQITADERFRIQMEAGQKLIQASELAAQQEQLRQAQLNKTRLAGFKGFLGSLAGLSASGNKTLGGISKGANIAQATMSGLAAANEAWKQGGFFLGPVFAAAVLAATGANIAKISSTPLQEGGVVQPVPGGTLATVAEAGAAEAVIPLDDPEAQDQIQDAIGTGGGVTIQVGTLIADEMSLDELAVSIDERLFRLGNNRQRVSDG